MGLYDRAYVTRDQVMAAEKASLGYLAHDDMVGLLEWMDRENLTEMPWFRMSSTQRDILEWVRVKPLFHNVAVGDSK